MNPDNDYDDEGNNIVPCPICGNQYCPSKEDGKCPEEDDFVRDMTIRDLEKKIHAMSMIIYLKLVKDKPWSDADTLIYRQAVKHLNTKT